MWSWHGCLEIPVLETEHETAHKRFTMTFHRARGKYPNKLREPHGEREPIGLMAEPLVSESGETFPEAEISLAVGCPNDAASAAFLGIFKAFSNQPCRSISLLWCAHRRRSRRGRGALWAPQLWHHTVFGKDIFGKGLNLPALLDIQWPKCFQLQGGEAPLNRGSALDSAGGSAPRPPL